MGRWKRKEHKHRSKKVTFLNLEGIQESESEVSPTSNTYRVENNNVTVLSAEPAATLEEPIISSTTHSPATFQIQRNFNAFEQERLYEYLLEYKRLGEHHYCAPISTIAEERATMDSNNSNNGSSNQDSNSHHSTVRIENQKLTGSASNEGKFFAGVEYNCSDGLNIAGHIFPKLTLEYVSSKPYLILPITLNKKQRRCIHELCIEAGLFHESIGDHPYKRHLIVSPFQSGFDSFLKSGQLKPPNCIPVRGCKPWFYRTHDQTSTLNVMKMCRSVQKKGDIKLDGTTADSTSSTSIIEKMVFWHFSRERNRTTVGIEFDIVNTQWKNEDDQFGEEVLTPRLNNTAQFQTQQVLLEKTELISSYNTNDVSSNLDICSDLENIVPLAMKVAKEKIYELIDQPSQCIRNIHDEIDFQKLRNHDLSTLVPLGVGETSYLLVNSKETMLQCIEEIENADPDVLAFDMEMYNPSAHTCITCLLQLATASTTYVVDVLVPEVWNLVSLLAPIFADPNVVKVGQAIGILDVPSLQRDFGIFIVNAFDTYEAGRLLRLPKLGLSALCEYYGLPHDECKEYHRLKKSYQMTDWRKRPLSPSMLRYGRFDVHYLIALRKLMIRDLTRGDLWDDGGAKRTKTIIKAEAVLVSKTLKALLQRSGKEYAEDSDDTKSMATSQGSTEDGYFTPEEDALDDKQVKKVEKENSGDAIVKKLKMNANLMSVLSESQQRCLSFWKNKKEHVKLRHGLFYSGAYYDNSQSETKWSEHHSRLCEALVDWRQSIAKNEGTMPGLVFSTEFLMAVARKRPASHCDLRRLSYFLPELLQDEQSVYAKQLFDLVQSFEFDRESCEPEELEAKYFQTTTANAEPEVTNVARSSEEKFGRGEPINYQATTLTDQTEGITRGHGKPTSDDHFGLLTYCITFVAFMAVGASVAVAVCRRYRR